MKKSKIDMTRKEKMVKNLKEWIYVIVVFVTVNFFLYQPFKIPSGSMIPTFLVGDFLIVNKFCYGYSNDSFRIGTFTFPLPQFTKRAFSHNTPKYGEVIVFRNEKDKNLNYIKRVVGLPGDTVQVIDGVVHINQNPVELKQIDDFSMLDKGEYITYKRYIEKLPNGYEHVIIKFFDFGKGNLDNTGPFVVPDGHYFLMGDNRDNSQDSRVMEAVGFIPFDKIMGKAEAIFFSSNCKLYEIFKWPFSIRFERIGSLIK
ncbi:MAG: signal peptidase I [Holosporales bacterium]|jgi:signal peptidase I|nr:signal peptidase I [Holosporales bacterium]